MISLSGSLPNDSWDLLNATLTIPQPRVDRLLSALDVFKDKLPFVTPRFIASIVGKIISLSPCVGNVSLIMSRFLQSAVFFMTGILPSI